MKTDPPPDGRDPGPADPESADPVPMQPLRPSLWQSPLVRAVANGAFFAMMLCVIQVYGIFRTARPLDDESVTGNIMAGVVFAGVMYVFERWRRRRRSGPDGRGHPAAEAARRAVEDRLRRNDPEDPGARR